MKLIIVRHGETKNNKIGICQGHAPTKLSKAGIIQARKVAKRLSKEKIDIIFSSDLRRAKDTAKEIRKFHKKTPIHFLKELREKKLGCLEGRTHEEYFAFFEKHAKKGRNVYRLRPRGGESFYDIKDRVKKFYNMLLKEHIDENVLVVTHGGWIRTFLVMLMKLHPKKTITPGMKQHNTAVNIIKADNNLKHKVHLINCTKHLKWNKKKLSSGEKQAK